MKHTRILEHANLNQDKEKFVTEDRIENHLRRECLKRRALVFKLQTAYRGLFDRFIIWYRCECFKTNIDFVECKRPKGGKYEAHQEYWRDEFKKRGCNAGTLNTIAKIDRYIKWRTCKHTKIIKPAKNMFSLHLLANSSAPRKLNVLKKIAKAKRRG